MKSNGNEGTHYTEVGSNNAHLNGVDVPIIRADLWTSSQRRSNSIHEISYRACFKAELPGFFITRFSREGDIVYDPFMGRGTTLIEAALNRRIPYGVDISPLSAVFAAPRLDPPTVEEIAERLEEIPMYGDMRAEIDLSMFFHSRTESELMSMRRYLSDRRNTGQEDGVDRFIRMIATNRLTGHSAGFFSVYTLPPNQAATPESQIRINSKRDQVPEYKDVKGIIMRKSQRLLKGVDDRVRENLRFSVGKSSIYVMDSRDTSARIPDNTVSLTVTSPPFLNVVQYKLDNWMRLWFNGIDFDSGLDEPFVTSSLKEWSGFIGKVFGDLHRVTKPGGRVAFEVGEIRNGSLKLEDYVVDAGSKAGFDVEKLFINTHNFTKTSNIWGVRNNMDGTNTNRIVLFRKEA